MVHFFTLFIFVFLPNCMSAPFMGQASFKTGHTLIRYREKEMSAMRFQPGKRLKVIFHTSFLLV
jgi:hypothetical protein